MTSSEYIFWLKNFIKGKKTLTNIDMLIIKNELNKVNGGVIDYKQIELKNLTNDRNNS